MCVEKYTPVDGLLHSLPGTAVAEHEERSQDERFHRRNCERMPGHKNKREQKQNQFGMNDRTKTKTTHTQRAKTREKKNYTSTDRGSNTINASFIRGRNNKTRHKHTRKKK